MTPPEVLALWKKLTGHSWRLVPYEVQAQAVDFATAEFTAEEMMLVVAYTKREMARNSSGFNPQSLTWRVLAADRWAKFQERLDLAREADQRRPLFRREVPTTRQISASVTQTVMDKAPEQEAAPVDPATVSAALHDFANLLRGQSGKQEGRTP